MASEVCPLLGLDDDRGAYLTYPSYENRCYAADTGDSIALNEQTFFCLGGHMERCPRYQAWQSSQSTADPASEAAPAVAAVVASDQIAAAEAQDMAQASVGQPISYGDDLVWQEAGDAGWTEADQDLPPPPPPPAWLLAGPEGQSRRPVWPIMLAAGTLIGVLMLCAFASAGWIGLRALTTQLAMRPSSTPAPIADGTGVPTAVGATPGAVAPTATLEPPMATALAGILATQTSAAATATAAVVVPTATPSPTESFVFDTPTVDFSTPTPTWTPIAFETPTPRDTPIFFPTNTPTDLFFPTSTFTSVPATTPTPSVEPFFVSFVANPTSIIQGQTSTLTWTVRGVKAIYLDGQAVSGPTGSQIVKPSVTTTYILRIIMPDNTVREEAQTVTVTIPTPSVTPTVTPTGTPEPTPTPTALYLASFSQNLSLTSINGTESSCRVDNGCTLFVIQVVNRGNRPILYWLSKTETLPIGWGAFFCWAGDCVFDQITAPRTLAVNQRENISLNFRVPATLVNDTQARVEVKGYYRCDGCSSPQINQPYSNTFTVYVILPTSTPVPTGTLLPTATPTLTPSFTPTATATPTVTATTPAGAS